MPVPSTGAAAEDPGCERGVRAKAATGPDVAMIGSVVSGIPAVMVVVPLVEYMQVGESYDLIIGIDGSRVKQAKKQPV